MPGTLGSERIRAEIAVASDARARIAREDPQQASPRRHGSGNAAKVAQTASIGTIRSAYADRRTRRRMKAPMRAAVHHGQTERSIRRAGPIASVNVSLRHCSLSSIPKRDNICAPTRPKELQPLRHASFRQAHIGSARCCSEPPAPFPVSSIAALMPPFCSQIASCSNVGLRHRNRAVNVESRQGSACQSRRRALCATGALRGCCMIRAKRTHGLVPVDEPRDY